MSRKRLSLLTILLILLPPLALAQDDNLNRLLPPNEIAPGFRTKAEPRLYSVSNLYEYMNGEAEMYREYGVMKFLAQVFGKGTVEIKVEIAEMVDEISAYGIHSFYRPSNFNLIEIGDEGIISSNQISFWQYRYYCKITAFGRNGELMTTSTHLAKEISSRIAGRAKVPEIITLLPVKDRIKGTEKIIKGMLALNNQYYLFQEDLFGFKAKAVGACAEYGKPEKKIRLFIVEYPSTDEAHTAFKRIQNELKKRSHSTEYRDDSKETNFLSSQTTDTCMVCQQKGNLLALVIGKDEMNARALLHELRW
jgi:hypothetical protein